MSLVDTIELLYGPPMDVISNCLRGCITSAPGHDLLVADFSAIEARGVAWLAGEERVLDVFRTEADIYCHAASDIYGRPISKKTDPDERQIGKVVVLACIAAGQPVLTPRGLIPIEDVLLSDKVWDGIEWVSHGGVVIRGERGVWTYQGLSATADHIVLGADGRELSFGDCILHRLPIALTGSGSSPITFVPFTRGEHRTSKQLPRYVGAVPVFDLLNAGPRNRFTVSGLLVHNCGYQGSVGAFQAMARGYGVKVPDAKVKEIVSAWRDANQATVAYWADVERAAIAAVQNKGAVCSAGPTGREVKFLQRGSFLFCRLPSGRALSYPYPRLLPYIWIRRALPPVEEGGEPVVEQRRVPDRELAKWLARGWKQNGEPGAALHYKYVDATTRSWTEGPTYGGSLVENITQAICRDLLAAAIIRLEARGYPIILHVHDEVVSEVPEGFGDLAEFEAITAEAPAWAAGFPITAEGWRGKRYRK